MTVVPFGEFRPDVADFVNDGVKQAKNVRPTNGGYAPVRDLVTTTDALDDRAQGAFATRQTSGPTFSFAGDAGKLYRRDGETWTDVSKVATTYNTQAEEQWRFERFGDNIVATNFTDEVQRFILGVDSNFSDLDASAPKFRYMAVVKEFLIAADTDDVNFPVRWPDQNDITSWTIGAPGSVAGGQPIPDGGPIRGIVGGEFAILFQDSAITRITFIGPPVIFQFDTVESEIGAQVSGSIVQFGSLVFFRSDSGFYVTDGVQTRPIGDKKVDETFTKLADPAFFGRMSTAVDEINKCILWNYVSVNAQNQIPDRQFIYSMSEDRWSESEIENELIYAGLSVGTSLDALDAISASIDALGQSLDSAAFQGGSRSIAMFDSLHKAGTLSGATLAVTLETGDKEISQDLRTTLSEVRPIVDNTSANIRVASRVRPADASIFTASSAMNTSGRCPVRANGRYHRFELQMPAGSDWTHAEGVDTGPVQAEGTR